MHKFKRSHHKIAFSVVLFGANECHYLLREAFYSDKSVKFRGKQTSTICLAPFVRWLSAASDLALIHNNMGLKEQNISAIQTAWT